MSGYVGNKKSVSFVSAELPIRKGIESIVEEDGSYRLLDGASLKKSDGSPVIHSDGTIDGVDLSPIQNQIDSIEADITSLNSSIDMVDLSPIQNQIDSIEADITSLNSSIDMVEASLPSHSMNFRNKIINGDMRIDQRNAGASITPSTNGTYTLDRWATYFTQNSKFSVEQNANSITPPSGFTNYLGITVGASANVTLGVGDEFELVQSIEGYNTSNLDFGKSTAKTITLSFWVRSSLTGTFGGTVYNSAVDYVFPFSYTIVSANTWEYKTITIPGQTAGTWSTTNGTGVQLLFSLGAGSNRTAATANTWVNENKVGVTGQVNLVETNGATFYITGVQLEEGPVATPFEHRPIGTELALCQRYFEKSHEIDDAPGTLTTDSAVFFRSISDSSTVLATTDSMRVEKRASPTIVVYDRNGNSGKICINDSITDPCNISTFSVSSYGKNIILIYNNSQKPINGMSFNWVATAEL